MSGIASRLLLSALAMMGCQTREFSSRESESASSGKNHLPGYVGSAKCAQCHEAEYRVWSRSLHAAALRPMELPGVSAVFDGEWREFGSTHVRPIRQDGQAILELRAAEGTPISSHPLRYVLGRDEIEQFVIAGKDGGYQALPAGYDAEQGEWFDIFPGSPDRRNWNFWANPGMTANSQCFACHVTGYRKGWVNAEARYESSWVEPGVGCEACHGPGLEHTLSVNASRPVADPYGGYSDPTVAAESCVPCHSRRTEVAPAFEQGMNLYDHFDFEVLDTETFAADGQAVAEAFEWTSFRMSLMARRGVGCQDCHRPHDGELTTPGDELCLGCHTSEFASATHTHHDPATAGARCVGCHMPEVFFMERDGRRDHRFPRPAPETSRLLGIPDPCLRCHVGRSAGWSAEHVGRWYGPSSSAREETHRAALAIMAGRQGDEAAVPDLIVLLQSSDDPVYRASAARLLAAFPVPSVREALIVAVLDKDPLVRAAVAEALGATRNMDNRAAHALIDLTKAPERLVRVEAAFALRGIDREALSASDKKRLELADAEWLEAQDLSSDGPASGHNKGIYFTARGDTARAEAAYRAAIDRWPGVVETRHNLGMLLVDSGRIEEAEKEFVAALDWEPEWPPAAFSLGLLYGQRGQLEEALAMLQDCVRQNPRYPRALYNLGVLYGQLGRRAEAVRVLEAAATHPDSRRDALDALAQLSG